MREAARQYLQQYGRPKYFIFSSKTDKRSRTYYKMIMQLAPRFGYRITDTPPDIERYGVGDKVFTLVDIRRPKNPEQDLDEVTIDNRDGAGATGYNANVDYRGLRVMMRPSVFLRLAAPLGGAHSAELERYIAQGGAIGAPFLLVEIPDSWEQGDFDSPAAVYGHEGRNRMSAVRKLEGDEPIEVHLIPAGENREYRNRHLTAQHIKALNRWMRREKSSSIESGPLFTVPALAEAIQIRDNTTARDWIRRVYDLYPGTWQHNHVMTWGSGDDQQFAAFELVPNPARPDTVEIKWFQAVPQRSGVGTRAMQELQRLASEDGIALSLFVWDKGQVSPAKLSRFYRSVGFKPTQKGSRSLEWRPELDEGWREKTAAAMAAATLGYGALTNTNTPAPEPARPTAAITQPTAPQADTDYARFQKTTPADLLDAAWAAGLRQDQLEYFIGQCVTETKNYKRLEEDLNYTSTARLMQVFPKRIKNKQIAKKFLGNPEALANYVYANRNGNKYAGDGWKYRGRGYLMLTGRELYQQAGDALGLDLVNNPDMVLDPKIAARTAIWYWQSKVSKRIPDFSKTNVRDVTKHINPAMQGIKQRQAHYAKIAQR